MLLVVILDIVYQKNQLFVKKIHVQVHHHILIQVLQNEIRLRLNNDGKTMIILLLVIILVQLDILEMIVIHHLVNIMLVLQRDKY